MSRYVKCFRGGVFWAEDIAGLVLEPDGTLTVELASGSDFTGEFLPGQSFDGVAARVERARNGLFCGDDVILSDDDGEAEGGG